jgi:diadenylate cyclase
VGRGTRNLLSTLLSREEARRRLKELHVADLSDTRGPAAALGYPVAHADLALRPRGFRQLAQVPRLPGCLLVEEFGSLEALTCAPEGDHRLVRGARAARARAIRRGLALSRELKLPVKPEQPG